MSMSKLVIQPPDTKHQNSKGCWDGNLLQLACVAKNAVPLGPTALSMLVLGLERLAVTGAKPDSEDDWR